MPDAPEPTLRILGRPRKANARSCVLYARVTPEEYEGVQSLLPNPRHSVSDLVRDLLSEAVLARMTRQAKR